MCNFKCDPQFFLCLVKGFSLWNVHPTRSQFPLIPGGGMWRPCLWVCAVACALFRSRMSALQQQGDSAVVHFSLESRAAGSRRRYTMSSCGSVRCGRETSAAPLLQNPLVTWFCLCTALFISRQCAKRKKKKKKNRAQKHTNCVQMTTEEMQLQETHSPPTLP